MDDIVPEVPKLEVIKCISINILLIIVKIKTLTHDLRKWIRAESEQLWGQEILSSDENVQCLSLLLLVQLTPAFCRTVISSALEPKPLWHPPGQMDLSLKHPRIPLPVSLGTSPNHLFSHSMKKWLKSLRIRWLVSLFLCYYRFIPFSCIYCHFWRILRRERRFQNSSIYFFKDFKFILHRILFFFSLRLKKHNTNYSLHRFLSVQYIFANYGHTVVQQIPRNFSFCITETLYLLKLDWIAAPPFVPFLTSSNHYFTFCF